jgi:hypothetical protein
MILNSAKNSDYDWRKIAALSYCPDSDFLKTAALKTLFGLLKIAPKNAASNLASSGAKAVLSEAAAASGNAAKNSGFLKNMFSTAGTAGMIATPIIEMRSEAKGDSEIMGKVQETDEKINALLEHTALSYLERKAELERMKNLLNMGIGIGTGGAVGAGIGALIAGREKRLLGAGIGGIGGAGLGGVLGYYYNNFGSKKKASVNYGYADKVLTRQVNTLRRG